MLARVERIVGRAERFVTERMRKFACWLGKGGGDRLGAGGG